MYSDAIMFHVIGFCSSAGANIELAAYGLAPCNVSTVVEDGQESNIVAALIPAVERLYVHALSLPHQTVIRTQSVPDLPVDRLISDSPSLLNTHPCPTC